MSQHLRNGSQEHSTYDTCLCFILTVHTTSDSVWYAGSQEEGYKRNTPKTVCAGGLPTRGARQTAEAALRGSPHSLGIGGGDCK